MISMIKLKYIKCLLFVGIDMEFLGRAEASSTRFGKNFNASISTNNATINLAKKATNKANNITNNANVLNAEERYYRSKFSLWSGMILKLYEYVIIFQFLKLINFRRSFALDFADKFVLKCMAHIKS